MVDENLPFLASKLRERKKDGAGVQPMGVDFARNAVIHGLIAISYFSFGLLFIRHFTSNCLPDIHAINDLNVVSQHRSENLYESTAFVGLPSVGTDVLWNQLLEHKNIRVSEDELLKNDRKSVNLPGGGYLAWIGVFHELHCLDLLRRLKYKSYYFTNTSQAELQKMERHTDHCLDRLRAVVMCHPDTSSITTFFWDKEAQPKVNGTKTLRNCVDWDLLMDSMKKRVISHAEMASLRNPTRRAGS